MGSSLVAERPTKRGQRGSKYKVLKRRIPLRKRRGMRGLNYQEKKSRPLDPGKERRIRYERNRVL